HISQSSCRYTPSAPTKSPPHQQRAATKPALRGPARSSQPPQIAAADPSTTKKRVNIQPRLEIRQSQVVVKSSPPSERSRQETVFVMPIARERLSQKTLPWLAMPNG